MNIAQRLDNQLNSSATASGASISVDQSPRCLRCRIDKSDALAVSFIELRLTTSELANASAAELERLSRAIGDRLTYLLEPITPVELDRDQCVVQMRSNPPQQDDDGRSYYELLVRRGGELSLARYRKEPGDARKPIPATVTREVLLRLVSDMDAAIDEFAAGSP